MALLLLSSIPATAQNISASRAEASFVTLGTGGGPVIRVERSESANAILVGDAIYLFDVGDGVQQRLAAAGLRPERLRAIFISHHHIDHVGGLSSLLVNRWLLNSYAAIPVFGPPGTVGMVRDIVRSARPVELAPVTSGGPPKPGFATTVSASDLERSMNDPQLVYADENIRVMAVANDHYHFPPGSREARHSRSYSFRAEAGGRSFVYTGDTGPSVNLERLAKGADVLVSEVIDMDGVIATLKRSPNIPVSALPAMVAHMREDHLTPAEVGKLAATAGVKQVVLTHLVPGNDGETDLSVYTNGISDHFNGEIRVARDLDRF